VKAVSIIVLAIFTFAAIGCGKDGGIPATLHQKVPPTPPTVEQKAMSVLSGSTFANLQATSQNTSSDFIKANLIGINATFVPSSKTGSTTMALTLAQRHGTGNDCTNDTFKADFVNADAQKWQLITGLGHMICLDQTCAYILLIIEQSSNQLQTSNGAIAAAVPVILKDNGDAANISSGSYIPTTSQASFFLHLENDTTTQCNAPVDPSTVTVPVMPDGYTGTPDYSYFPTNDYSTWF